MHISKERRETLAVLTVGIISITALLLVGGGIPATSVTDVLVVVLPPLVALAAREGRD